MKGILVICGPTATGKTSLGLKLAKKFNGQIISADSRQVYRGMDVVTGKDLPAETRRQDSQLVFHHKKLKYYNFDGIPTWGLDLVLPDQRFSVADWVQYSQFVINYLWEQTKLPILVGGTGFWLRSLFNQVSSLGIKPDFKLRQKLRHYSVNELWQKLNLIDPNKGKSMNHSDRHNSRRLIRAIEIAQAKQKPNQTINQLVLSKQAILKIGLQASVAVIEDKIKQRIKARLKQGAITEVKKLLEAGYDQTLPSMSACGYPIFTRYLKGEIDQKKLKKKWFLSERSYFKRQMVWFKKQKNIEWFKIEDPHWQKDVVTCVKNWYHYLNETKN